MRISKSSTAAMHGPFTSPMRPTFSACHTWTPTAASTCGRASTPPSMHRPMPFAPSSPGWKRSFAAPREGGRALSRRATSTSPAAWQSWPHACIAPRCRDANGSPVSSTIGSASMSARARIVRPLAPPSTSAVSPVFATRRGANPRPRSQRSICADVSFSTSESSASPCSSRRRSTTEGTADVAAARGFFMRRGSLRATLPPTNEGAPRTGRPREVPRGTRLGRQLLDLLAVALDAAKRREQLDAVGLALGPEDLQEDPEAAVARHLGRADAGARGLVGAVDREREGLLEARLLTAHDAGQALVDRRDGDGQRRRDVPAQLAPVLHEDLALVLLV